MDTIRDPVLPNINRVIKYRKTTCAGFVASTGERSSAQRTIVGKHKGKTSLGGLDVDGIIILKCIFDETRSRSTRDLRRQFRVTSLLGLRVSIPIGGMDV